MHLNMEDNLDLPLGELLKLLQKNILQQSTYFGIQTWKCPTDFWMYQEILVEHRPDVIIEIGCNRGGSALALAHICRNLGSGRVIGIDITLDKLAPSAANCEDILFIESDACLCFDQIAELVSPDERVLIIEDSSHTYDNTLAILNLYSSLLKVGDYFIVEDGIVSHGLDIGVPPGPYEAVEQFVSGRNDFVIDRHKERFTITWNPKGYLQKIS